jgi:hypothetical protein
VDAWCPSCCHAMSFTYATSSTAYLAL